MSRDPQSIAASGTHSRGRMKASDRVYETLLEEIQSGHLAPGTVLGEVEHAERFGVSRTPLREAIRRLVADGLVSQVSPRVTVVSALERKDIEALFEVRRALEECAVRIAAERGDADEFAELADEFSQVIISNLERENLEAYFALIRRMDQAIDASVQNDYLTSALRIIRTHLVRVRRMASATPERLAETAVEHRLIAEALAQRNPELAAHATHVHLYNALTNTLRILEASSVEEPAPKQESA